MLQKQLSCADVCINKVNKNKNGGAKLHAILKCAHKVIAVGWTSFTVTREGERGRCSRLTELYERVHVGVVAGVNPNVTETAVFPAFRSVGAIEKAKSML
jgi:hypothetical protein